MAFFISALISGPNKFISGLNQPYQPESAGRGLIWLVRAWYEFWGTDMRDDMKKDMWYSIYCTLYVKIEPARHLWLPAPRVYGPENTNFSFSHCPPRFSTKSVLKSDVNKSEMLDLLNDLSSNGLIYMTCL